MANICVDYLRPYSMKEAQPTKTRPIHKKQKNSALTNLPTIQDMMSLSRQERTEGAVKHFATIKPFLANYMIKKVGSRVLQLVFKWATDSERTLIAACLRENWNQIVRAPEALRLIGTVSKHSPLPEIQEDCFLLQATLKGAKVLHEYTERDPQAMETIKAKFYALRQAANGNDLKAQEQLHNLAIKAADKSYFYWPLSKLAIRLALGSMFAEERQRVMETLGAKVEDWTSDEEGVRLFIQLTNYADAKLKKHIIKAFKGNVVGIAELRTPIYVALIKIITQIDDTVLVKKTLLKEIEDLIPLMNQNKHAFAVVFSLLSPRNHNFNILGKYEHTPSHTECKKEEEVRKAEIRKELYPALLGHLKEQNMYHLLRNFINSKLVVAIYKALDEDGLQQELKTFISATVNLFLSDLKDSLKTNSFQNSLVAHPSANKILKSILLLSYDWIDYYCGEVAQLASLNMASFLRSKASFVVLSLIEKGGRDDLLRQVKRSKVPFDEMVGGEHYQALLRK